MISPGEVIRSDDYNIYDSPAIGLKDRDLL